MSFRLWSTFKLFERDQKRISAQFEVTWSLTVRDFAFDPVWKIVKWIKSEIWTVLSHTIETACIFLTWLTSSIFWPGSEIIPPRTVQTEQVKLRCYRQISDFVPWLWLPGPVRIFALFCPWSYLISFWIRTYKSNNMNHSSSLFFCFNMSRSHD